MFQVIKFFVTYILTVLINLLLNSLHARQYIGTSSPEQHLVCNIFLMLFPGMQHGTMCHLVTQESLILIFYLFFLGFLSTLTNFLRRVVVYITCSSFSHSCQVLLTQWFIIFHHNIPSSYKFLCAEILHLYFSKFSVLFKERYISPKRSTEWHVYSTRDPDS